MHHPKVEKSSGTLKIPYIAVLYPNNEHSKCIIPKLNQQYRPSQSPDIKEEMLDQSISSSCVKLYCATYIYTCIYTYGCIDNKCIYMYIYMCVCVSIGSHLSLTNALWNVKRRSKCVM